MLQDKKIRSRKIPESLSELLVNPGTYNVGSPFEDYVFRDQSIPVPECNKINIQCNQWSSWMPKFEPSSDFIDQLSMELVYFHNKIAKTKQTEHNIKETQQRLWNTIKKYLPKNSSIQAFGSSPTPFGSSKSDVDVGIYIEQSQIKHTMRNGKRESLKILGPLLKPLRQLSNSWVNFVRNAKVPIIRYKDSKTRMQVDLSVQWDGFEIVKILNDLSVRYPSSIPVTLFLKYFFEERGVKDSSRGGLSGFACISMTVFIAQHLKNQGVKMSPGIVLMSFLYFFGYIFDPWHVGIDMALEGKLFFRHPDLETLYNRSEMYISSPWLKQPPENAARALEHVDEFREVCQVTFDHLFQFREIRHNLLYHLI